MSKEIKHLDDFALALCNLTPEQFLGVAHMLEVKWLTTKLDPETKKAVPRPAEDILLDCAEKFNDMSRKKRRNMLKAIRKWAEEKK